MTSRARSVATALAILGAVWWINPAPSSAATAVLATSQQIGTSVQGRPIEVACIGSGDRSVLLVGGLHTGPEAHSVDLVLEVARLAWSSDLEVPAATRLCILPVLNPDGLVSGNRTNARGVDLNRNWPALNWSADAYHPEGGAVSGGSGPLSEPETRALWNYVLQTRPDVVLVLHCCGAVVEANDSADAGALATAFAAGASMQHIAEWTAYPVTGQFIDAMDRIGIGAMDIEMEALGDIALDDHRAGLVRVLDALEGASSQPPVVRQAAVTRVTYRVLPGDTLANIAVRHGTTADVLTSINRLASPDLITVGQVLAVR